MKEIKYLLTRIFQLNYKNFFHTIDIIHEKAGLSKARLLFDMSYCGLKYGAGYSDYSLCEFYTLNKEQRSTYVTRGINNRIVKLLNQPEYAHFFEDKSEFNKVFRKYIHRDWIETKDINLKKFQTFIEKHDIIISKPLDSACGSGIQKLKRSDFGDLDKMYRHIQSSNTGILEDCIIQHPDISAIYPFSVNTYRIVTVLSCGEPHIVYAFIRIGNKGHYVDNINAGGMAAPIDIETGTITYPAFDKDSVCYEFHPMTGCNIVGYSLPYWRESLDMCLSAALVMPQIGYVGWDIAVSEDGPQLLEGNQFPGHDILQMPPHVPDKIGMLPRFREFVKGI